MDWSGLTDLLEEIAASLRACASNLEARDSVRDERAHTKVVWDLRTMAAQLDAAARIVPKHWDAGAPPRHIHNSTPEVGRAVIMPDGGHPEERPAETADLTSRMDGLLVRMRSGDPNRTVVTGLKKVSQEGEPA